jgi:hypothetical protein
MLPDTYTTTGPFGLAVWKFTAPLPLSLIEVAEKTPGPVIVWPPIAPSWLAAGIAGGTGIGSDTFAFVVHVPEVCGLLEIVLALVPMSAPHAFGSLQLVESEHAVAALYAPVELSQLSIVPEALKL